MNADRFVITDHLWDRISGLLPGRDGTRGVSGKDNRLFLEAVLWRVRAGLPWRDLPPEFGNWNTQFRRFRRWAAAGVFETLFEALAQTLTLNTPSLTAPLLAFTRKPVAQKGDSKSGYWALKRWADDEDRGLGGCFREPGSLFAAARPSS